MFDAKNLHHAYLIEGDKASVFSEINDFLEDVLHVVIKNNPDYWHAEFDNFGIDDGRSLKERAGMKALSKKFFIVSFNFITAEAQNSLLKVLEEPTAGTHFFFITPSSDHLLPTLKSRLAIVTRYSDMESGERIEAEKFLKASKSERLQMVKEMEKADAIAFVNNIENVLYSSFKKNKNTEIAKSLQRVLDFKGYLFDRGSSTKLILEYFAVLL